MTDVRIFHPRVTLGSAISPGPTDVISVKLDNANHVFLSIIIIYSFVLQGVQLNYNNTCNYTVHKSDHPPRIPGSSENNGHALSIM